MSMEDLQRDADIIEEAQALREIQQGQRGQGTRFSTSPPSVSRVRLHMQDGAHRPSHETAQILKEIGGGDAIRRMTTIFYQKAIKDPRLEKFIRNPNDPHGERLGNWIVEKMGGEGDVWTQERMTRPHTPVTLAGGIRHVVHDRTSAHAAAWHSPKREPHEVGERFKLDDCRVWMRLMFWSAREAGLFEASPKFAEWYPRFIGHFVRVYERTAQQFARDAFRWSADARNTQAYHAAGNRMRDVDGVPLREALLQLPVDERSGMWPYD
eukprot:Rmarinus@m.27507